MDFFLGFLAGLCVLVYVVGVLYIWLANQMGNGDNGYALLWPFTLIWQALKPKPRDGRI